MTDIKTWISDLDRADPPPDLRTRPTRLPRVPRRGTARRVLRVVAIAAVIVVVAAGIILPLKAMWPLGDRGKTQPGGSPRVSPSAEPPVVRAGSALPAIRRSVDALRATAGQSEGTRATTLNDAADSLEQMLVPLSQGVGSSMVVDTVRVSCNPTGAPEVAPSGTGMPIFQLQPDGLHVTVEPNGLEQVVFFQGPPGVGDMGVSSHRLTPTDSPAHVVADHFPGDVWVACASRPWVSRYEIYRDVTVGNATPFIVLPAGPPASPLRGVRLPDVTGQPISHARRILEREGFEVITNGVYRNGQPPSRVWKTYPAPSSIVRPGRYVTLVQPNQYRCRPARYPC